jgi:hypothetical protein
LVATNPAPSEKVTVIAELVEMLDAWIDKGESGAGLDEVTEVIVGGGGGGGVELPPDIGELELPPPPPPQLVTKRTITARRTALTGVLIIVLLQDRRSRTPPQASRWTLRGRGSPLDTHCGGLRS